MNELTQEQIQILNDLGCSNEDVEQGLKLGLSFDEMYSSTLDAQHEPAEWERNHMEGKGY